MPVKTSESWTNFLTHLVKIGLLCLLASCLSSKESAKERPKASNLATQALKTDRDGMSKARATIKTSYGDIIFKFYPEQAPVTVARFIELAQQGFYNGLLFHRVISNFVIQGGDPQGTGMGGSGQKLKAEFSDLQHIKGTVAMARAKDIHSADSQFYIALSTLPHLDKQYTVFGQVVSGLKILDKIKKGDKMIEVSIQK